jgi:amino acid adenylation domain-containing protein
MEHVLSAHNLAESLRRAAASDKQVTFVKGGTDHTSISYNTLYEEAAALSKSLYQAGLRENDELVIIFNDNELLLKAFWACILGKIIAIPVASGSQEIHKEKIVGILGQLKRPAIISDTAYLKDLDFYLDRITEGTSSNKVFVDGNPVDRSSSAPWKDKLRRIDISALPQAGPGIADISFPYIQSQDIAYIQYSSGSTGDPKGVVLTHSNLLSNTHAIALRLAITEKDVALSWLPLTHDMGMICFHLTSVISLCDQIIIPTTLFIKRPLLWMELATKFSATQLYSPNFGLQYILTAVHSMGDTSPDWQLENVRVIVNGAEPISESITRKFLDVMHQWRLADNVVFPGYGLAEASVAVTLPDVGHKLSFLYCKRSHLKSGCQVQLVQQEDDDTLSFAVCGYPVADCTLRIVDEQDHVLPDLHVGNIQVKGTNVTNAYYRRAEITDVFAADGWLRTGDLGFLSEGNLVVTGRKKNIIIINGQNYYPHDIEQLIGNELNLRPGSVVACSVPETDGQQQLAVFILFKGDMIAFYQQHQLARQLVISRMGIYPAYILPVRSIPKTTSGKVMHYQLIEDFSNGAFEKEIKGLKLLEENTRGVLADREETLSQILTEAGIAHDTKMNENLFNAGMNSLQALALINTFKKYGYDISFCTLYDTGTRAKLLSLMQHTGNETVEDITPTPKTATYPLSWGQQQIYIAGLMSPESPRFNIAFCVTINGPLDEDRFVQALQMLVQQHEILRSNIIWTDDGPLQIVRPVQVPVVEREDLSDVPNAYQLSESRLKLMAETVFSVDRDPLYRFYLVRQCKDQFRLGVVLHHIIVDGWSVRLIGKELGKLYASLAETDAGFPVPELQYRDFVHWQSQLPDSRQFQHQHAFWEQYLSGSLPQTSFPPSIRRKKTSDALGIGSAFIKRYSSALTGSIFAVAKQYNVTFFSVLMSALFVLVRKYNYDEGDDLLIGTDTMGRTHPKLSTQIGYFLNVLPCRLGIQDAMTFADLLAATHKNLLEVYDHQTYPIDTIVSRKQPSGQFSIYNILVLFQNFNEPLGFDGVLPGLDTHTTEIENGTCLNDLLFEFALRDEKLVLKVKYNTALYDEQYISDICQHLELVFEQLTFDPQMLIKHTKLLNRADHKLLLEQMSECKVEWPSETNDLVTAFEQQVNKCPSNTAIISGDLRLSYQDLNERANQVADWLRNVYAVRSNDLVGVCTGRNECLIIGILGILKAGAAYVPIDPEYPSARMRYIIDSGRISLLLTDRELDGEELQTHILPVYDRDLFTGYSIENSATAPSESDLAYVIYTSGSTGLPKGVMVRHRSVSNYAHGFAAYFNITGKDRVIMQSSIAFDTMVEEIFPALFEGATLIMASNGGRDIGALVTLVREHEASVLSVTPLILNELNRQTDPLSSLRLIVSGGDELQVAHIDRLIHHIPIYNTYGPTETTVCATYYPVKTLSAAGLIGKPIANVQVYILDTQKQLQPSGVAGEICIGGAGVSAGYLNNDALTTIHFIANPFGPGRLYCTGDMGRRLPDGNIEFLGRRDNQVKIRGYRIELGEIESTLLHSGLINQVAVTLVKNGNEHALAAYYTAHTEQSVSTLREYLQSRLPQHAIPAHFVQLEQFPLTVSGKIDRKALQQPQLKAAISTPPQTEVEMSIAHIWEDVLGHALVGREDNFFELGGHSIKAVQVISRIFRELSVKLELRDLFGYPVLSQLSERVEMQMWFNNPVETDLASNTDEIII